MTRSSDPHNSIDAIGAAVGKSRNAVASRRKRLHLPARTDGPKRRKPPTPAKSVKPKGASRGNSNGAAWSKAAKVAARASPPPLPAVPPSAPTVCILALERRHCRFIGERPKLIKVETPIYCGRRVQEGSSWCPYHHARVFTRVARQTPRAFTLRRMPV